jgi:hypothetical protein
MFGYRPTCLQLATMCFFFLWRYSPNSGLGLPPWNFPFHFSLLDLRHSVGLLGRVISSSQGLYPYTNIEKRTHTCIHKHQTSMPWVGFEPTIPASERAKTVHELLWVHWPILTRVNTREQEWKSACWKSASLLSFIIKKYLNYEPSYFKMYNQCTFLVKFLYNV